MMILYTLRTMGPFRVLKWGDSLTSLMTSLLAPYIRLVRAQRTISDPQLFCGLQPDHHA